MLLKIIRSNEITPLPPISNAFNLSPFFPPQPTPPNAVIIISGIITQFPFMRKMIMCIKIGGRKRTLHRL